MQSLEEIQRRLQSAIVGEAPGVDDLLLGSSTMTAEERLAIYQRAYLIRLVECMRAEFPMFCRAIEQEAFDDLAAMFLATHPPTSYTLAELGRAFPAFLSANMPADLPGRQALFELAELEWQTNEVFNGPGMEQEPPLDLAQLAPEHWDTLCLTLAPCVRLLEFATPAHEYYQQLRAGQAATPPANRPTWLIVFRHNYTVRHHAACEPLAWLLDNLRAGKPLAATIAALAERPAVDPETLPAHLHEWFRWIASHRLVVASSSR